MYGQIHVHIVQSLSTLVWIQGFREVLALVRIPGTLVLTMFKFGGYIVTIPVKHCDA